MSARNWCITSFKDTDKDEPPFGKEKVVYAIWQLEKTPTTGKLHWQIYVQFDGSTRLAFVKRMFGRECHAENARGSADKNIAYCSKPETQVTPGSTYGAPKRQGARTDLAAIAKMVQSGTTMTELAETEGAAFIQFGRGIKGLQFQLQKGEAQAFRIVKCTVIWGKTGTGKSKQALYDSELKFKPNMFVLPMPAKHETLWFDGYESERILVLDEFKCQVPMPYLLRLLDGHNLRLPTKGGHTYAMWNEIIITSNFDPLTWYSMCHQDSRDALNRRITSVINLL